MPEDFQPGQHLSPDQLSAFAENVLPEHERLAALTHLSGCADCRQVVFLAQQADPAPITTPTPETPHRGWFSLPQIFVAATTALACSLILALIIHLHPNQNPAVPPVATTQLQQIQPPQPIVPPAATPAPIPQEHSKQTPAPALPAQLSQVQMAPAPQPLRATGSGTAIGMESKAKVFELRPQDKQYFADSAASASTFAAPAPQKSPAVVGGMISMSAAPPAPPAQQEARARQAYAGPLAKSAKDIPTGAATAPTANLDTLAADDTTVMNAASIENLPLTDRNTQTYAALASPAIKLPSKKPVASQLNTSGSILALDTDGALFLSNDHGKHWISIATQWTGKAVQLSFAATPARLYIAQSSQNQVQSQIGNSNTGAAVAAGVPQQQAPIPTAGFELSTVTGAVWLSTDGLTWHPR